MFEAELVKEAGLTDGEAKVYLTLLELGSSTTGPLIEKSKVARSFIYTILQNLIDKGLVSYITKEKTNYYEAADPEKILEYLGQRQARLEESSNRIKEVLPRLKLLRKTAPSTEVRVYEGFNGVKTAFEHHEAKLQKGDEYLCFGAFAHQSEKYHLYWMQHHIKRAKKGIIGKMLMYTDTPRDVLVNRNSYPLCDCRYMPAKLKTPAWFLVYKDIVGIFLQDDPEYNIKKAMAVEIVNQHIADTFASYFDMFWQMSKPFR
ncbi:MAG: helix-turn-helix domain-containing protein [archaeon]